MKIKYVENVPVEVGGIWVLQNIVFIYSMFLGMENISLLFEASLIKQKHYCSVYWVKELLFGLKSEGRKGEKEL